MFTFKPKKEDDTKESSHVAVVRAKELKLREYGRTPSAKLRADILYEREKVAASLSGRRALTLKF